MVNHRIGSGNLNRLDRCNTGFIAEARGLGCEIPMSKSTGRLTRRVSVAALKSEVALAAIQEDKTLAEFDLCFVCQNRPLPSEF
jgi:hypothetical protein